MNEKDLQVTNRDFLIYKDDNGDVKVNVMLINHDLWLTQNLMSELFDTSRRNIGLHLQNIYFDRELDESSTKKEIFLVQNEGERRVKRKTLVYNLDAIIAVGYRVNSKKATNFRIWATKVLKEYMIKGFVLNDEKLKNNEESVYFEELLARIRDIRSSEKVFWRKVLDIYATSIDYDPKSELSVKFFKTVQNKMHYAAHGHTAAEVIFHRVDSNKENLGLTNFNGDYPTRKETEVAKNYLSADELNILNRMVSAYLDIAEINALDRHPMTMQDWLNELDMFLKMTKKDILKSSGVISHKKALRKAHAEYDKYMQNHLTRAEKDYLDVLNKEVNDLK